MLKKLDLSKTPNVKYYASLLGITNADGGLCLGAPLERWIFRSCTGWSGGCAGL